MHDIPEMSCLSPEQRTRYWYCGLRRISLRWYLWPMLLMPPAFALALRTLSRSIAPAELERFAGLLGMMAGAVLGGLLLAQVTANLVVKELRKVIPTLCSQCGYDLRGSPSGYCSECGSPVKKLNGS
jgi:hypothetical protein